MSEQETGLPVQSKDMILSELRSQLPQGPELDRLMKVTEDIFGMQPEESKTVDCFEAVARVIGIEPMDVAELANTHPGKAKPDMFNLAVMIGFDEPDQTVPDAVHVGLVVNPSTSLTWSKLGAGPVRLLTPSQLHAVFLQAVPAVRITSAPKYIPLI